MNPFFIDDRFYSDVETLLIDRELEKEDIEKLSDDYVIKAEDTDHEQMFQFKMEHIVDAITQEAISRFEDRFPEDTEKVDSVIEKAIKESIDIDKINGLIPSLYYPNGKEIILTKQDLLDAS